MPHLFPGRSRVTRGVGAPLGVTLTSLAHRAGDSSLPTPPAGLGGVEWVRTDPWIPPLSQEVAVSRLVWMMWQRVRMDPQSDPSETQFGELAGQIYIYTSPSSFPGEGNGNHSNILAWKIPWTEEPGRLQSTGSQRVRHD